MQERSTMKPLEGPLRESSFAGGEKTFLQKLLLQKQLLFMSLPLMCYVILFSYVPMWGWTMAFQNYKPARSFFQQDFVGLRWFTWLFSDENFFRVLRNTIAIFIAVGSWNAWFDTMIYNSGRVYLHTLQYKLMEFLQSSQSQSKGAAAIGAMGMAQDVSASMVTPVSIRAAITVVAALPILIIYPFLQRYFVTGLNVGGVKE
jgi:ABC-type glycerol-3-phosphate transport system permease component